MPKTHDLEMLKHIAVLAGISGHASTSTSKVAKALGISQQSASRRIRVLSAAGYLLAATTPRGIDVELTEHGRSAMKKQLAELKSIFAAGHGTWPERKLTGVVESGLGEGRYYVTQPNYNKRFQAFLGSAVYPGTLNLRVQEPELQKFISNLKQHTVAGFTTAERTFGSLRCYAVKVNRKVPAALILPERSTHPAGTAELVAKTYLREKLGLRDGDPVAVTV